MENPEPGKARQAGNVSIAITIVLLMAICLLVPAAAAVTLVVCYCRAMGQTFEPTDDEFRYWLNDAARAQIVPSISVHFRIEQNDHTGEELILP